MFSDLWPDVPDDEVPITLGHQRRARPHLGVARDGRPAHPPRAARVARGRGRALGAHRRGPRRRAVAGPRAGPRAPGRLRPPAPARASSWPGACRRRDVAWTDAVLDPEALTIGFARRFATYKRATLLLSQPERLKRAAAARRRPAGAVRVRRQGPPGRRQRQGADPPDRRRSPPTPTSATGSCSSRTTTSPSPARCYQGADVWLNNPRRPQEACGTSRHEGGAQRRAQLLDPRRLVGRVLRRRERLGHLARPSTSTTSSAATRSRPTRSSSCSSARSCRCSTSAGRARCPARWVQRVKRSLAHARPVRAPPPAWCATTPSSSTSRPPPQGDDARPPTATPRPATWPAWKARVAAGVARRARRPRRARRRASADLGAERTVEAVVVARRPRRPTTSRCSCSTARSARATSCADPHGRRRWTPAAGRRRPRCATAARFTCDRAGRYGFTVRIVPPTPTS